MTRDLRTRGPERGAQRDLTLADVGARQLQVGDVGARDQQNQAHGPQENQQRLLYLAGHELLHRYAAPRQRAESSVGQRPDVAGVHPTARDGGQLLRQHRRRSRVAQPGDALVRAIPPRTKAARVDAVGQPRLGGPLRLVVGRKGKPGRHHAGHDARASVHLDVLPDNLGRAAEAALPQPVAQDDDFGAAGHFGRRRHTADERRHAHELEEVRGNGGGAHALGLLAASEIGIDLLVAGDRGERAGPRRRS